MRSPVYVFMDMDGVAVKYSRADYITPGEPGDIPAWLKPGYFERLDADERAVAIAKWLIELSRLQRHLHFRFLSGVSNDRRYTRRQIDEKRNWLEKIFGASAGNLLVPVTCGNKVRTARQWIIDNATYCPHYTNSGQLFIRCLLIDDYKKNLKEWENAGGTAIKYCNGINSEPTKTSECLFIHEKASVLEAEDFLEYVIELAGISSCKGF